MDQVLVLYSRAERVQVVDALVDLGAEAHTSLADALPDQVLEPGEAAGADEEHLAGVDLDQLLLGPVARAVRRDRREAALEQLEQRLLYALARDVTAHRRTPALARELVDLVDTDDPDRGAIDVPVCCAVERLDDALDVFADVPRFGQGGRVG